MFILSLQLFSKTNSIGYFSDNDLVVGEKNK